MPLQGTIVHVGATTSDDGDFVRGLKQSGRELLGTGYGLAALAGAAAGAQGLKDWGLENAQEQFDRSQAMSRPSDQLEGIDSVGGAIDYAQRGLGYVAGQALPAVLTGGIGALTGRALAARGVQQLTREQLAQAAARGGVAGAAAASYGQEAGSMYPDMVQDGHDEPGRAALFALPAAALDVVPEARAIMGLARPARAAAGGVLRRAGGEALKQGALEGATEVGQTAIERAAAHKSLTDADARSDYLNSGALGVLGGGVFGGVSGAMQRPAVRTVDQGPMDLTQPQQEERPVLGLGYSPLAGTPIIHPDGTVTLNGDQELDARYPNRANASVVPLSPDQMGGGLGFAGTAPYLPTTPLDGGRQFDTPAWDTAPGAGPRSGIDFSRDVDTGPLDLVTNTRDPSLIDFVPAGREQELSLAPPGANLTEPAPGSIPYVRPVNTDGMSLAPRSAPSANTLSPKGQVLNQLAMQLQEEGHLDDGSAVQATTLIAQGKFNLAKKILDNALKEKTAADSLVAKVEKLKEKEAADADTAGAGKQRTGAPAVAGGVQRAGGQRDAAGVPGPAADAPSAARAGGEDALALSPNERDGALEDTPTHAVTSEALVQVAEDSKNIDEYEGALDELYRRWRDDGDEVAQGYFEANKSIPGFAADMQRTRERAGEKANTQEPASQGKRGLKLGRQETGKLSDGAKATDDVLRGLGTIKQAAARYPDKGREPAIPEGVKFKDGRDAAQWLAENSRQPFIRFLMRKILPYLGDVQVHLLQIEDKIPGYVASYLNGTSMAITERKHTGETAIWVRAYDGNTENIWAHELLHAATMARLQDKALRQPLRSLAAQVRATLVELAGNFDSNAEAYEFFQGKFRDTDEFLAYATTSPTFQELMKRIGPDGKVLELRAPEAQLPERQLSLWERFVDMIRSLFGLPKVYAPQVEAILAANRKIAERNAAPQETLAGEVERLLGDLLKATEPARSDAQVRTARDAQNPTAPDPGGVAQVQQASADPAGRAMGESFAKLPYANTALGRMVQDALFNIKESPWALKWTTNDQIAEGYKHLKPVQEINRATARMASVANRYLETAAQTAKKWRALPDDVQLAMQKLMLQTTMDEMHVAIRGEDGKQLGAEEAWNHTSNAHIEKTPANRAKFGQLYQAYQALPASAKTVYETVRDDLARQHEDTLRALRKSVADQYTGQLKRVLTDAELLALANSDAGVKATFQDTAEIAASATELRALNNLYQALRDVTKDFGTIRGPYFPLVRFGDHVVVMKSADLMDLELNAQSLRTELQQAMENAPASASEEAEGHDAKVSDLRGRYNEALKAVEKAKQDEKKYAVEFHESAAQAERAREALAAKYPDADVYRSVREQYYRALDGASPAFLKNLQETLGAALDAGDGVSAEAKSTALQAMKDMYLRRQPERSALRAELRRMNIEGVQAAQMLRGYAQQARNGAWRISRLLHAGEVTAGLANLSDDRRSADAKHVTNELKARFVGDIAPPENSKWLQRLQSATYFMHLGFNVSYFATNATQAWTTSLPVMAGRHGIVNAANSLTAASKDVIALLSKATAKSIEENGAVVGLQLRLTDEQINSLAKDDAEARMLKTLTDDGVVDITIKHDLGAISDGTSNSLPGKVMELSSALANYPELYNRLSTALAAYRMERARREGGAETDAQVQDRAERYAEYIINRTHFNYSPENAPRMMRGQLGRLVFQFKRYQQGMIYLFAKLVKDASNGDTASARSLMYLLGMTVSVGGVVSLPIAAPVALATKIIASMYPDDDEPQLLAQWYNGMKDGVGETIAQILAKGLPAGAGLDLSGKLGQGNLLNPLAFANTDGKKFFSRDYWTEVGFALLGPSAALIGNEAEAVGYAKEGKYLQAAEKGMPTFVSNAIKAYRRADEGLATKAGDTIMAPEEFGLGSIAAKALGFETAQVSDTYQNRSAYLEAVKGRQDARKGLLREYYEAVRAGDSDRMQTVQQSIREFNDRQPADRVRGKDLAAAIKQHAQRARETHGGLRVGKRDQDTYRGLMGQE